MNKVLLLNLPSRIPCYRVLHRAKIGNPNYIWPCVDLIYMSGYLQEAGNLIDYKDFQFYNKTSIWDFLKENRYDSIIATYSPFLEDEDLMMLQEIKSKFPRLRIFLLANHKDRLDKSHIELILREYGAIEAMIYDYAYNNFAAFINGLRGEELFNVFYLEGSQLLGRIEKIPQLLKIPIPRHDLFVSDAYFHYDNVGGKLTNAMASFGCKRGCQFCWAGKLYPAVSTRSPDNLISEMEYIVGCGISEVYFHDYTFGYHARETLRFCNLMVEKSVKLRWFCSSRLDIMTDELIDAMAASGCRCIEFGLESGNYEVRKKYGKDISDKEVIKVIKRCRDKGIHVSVFMILGLPEETLADMKRSVDFVRSLKVDYVAFNVLWSEPFTELNNNLQQVIEDIPSSQSMKQMNFKHPNVTNEEITRFYQRCILRFYFNPLFIIKQLFSIRSFRRIKSLTYLVYKLLFKGRVS